LAAALAMLLLAGPAAAGQSGAREGAGFCASPAPRDYSAPLDRLPRIRRIPDSGQLPFGPRHLSFYPTYLYAPVIVGGGSFGYSFFDEDFSRTLRLDWTLRAQLFRIDGKGRPVEEIDHRQIEVGKVEDAYPVDLRLELPPQPGNYRVDVEFLDSDGRLLGKLGEYLRVVRPWTKARLGISGRHFNAGDVVRTRIENIGTTVVNSGAFYAVQRRTAGAWRNVPGVTPEVWPLYASIIGPGGTGECGGFRIPADLPPGRYRVLKTAGSGYGRDSQALRLTASFDID
jgi:hypothetical protein